MSIETQIDIVVKNLNRLKDVSASLQAIQKSNAQLVKGLNKVETKLANINKSGSSAFSSMDRSAASSAKNVNSLSKSINSIREPKGLKGIFANVLTSGAAAALSVNGVTEAVNGLVGGLGMSITPTTGAMAALNNLGAALASHPALWGLAAAGAVIFSDKVVPATVATVKGIGRLGRALNKTSTDFIEAKATAIDFKIGIINVNKQMENMVRGASLKEISILVNKAKSEMEGFWSMTRGAEQAAIKLVTALKAQREEQKALDSLKQRVSVRLGIPDEDNKAALEKFKNETIENNRLQLAQQKANALERSKQAKHLLLVRKIKNRERAADRAAAKDAERARRNENLMLGVGFPMLFGGGLGAVAGGAGGALLQDKMGPGRGFGAQILLSAIGQQFDRLISSMVASTQKLGNALGQYTQNTGHLVESLGLAGTAEGQRIKIIEELEGKQAAFNAAVRQLTNAVGAKGAADLKQFGDNWRVVSSEFKIFFTQIQAGVANLINAADRFFGVTESAKETRLERFMATTDDPEIVKLRKQREALDARKIKGGNLLGEFTAGADAFEADKLDKRIEALSKEKLARQDAQVAIDNALQGEQQLLAKKKEQFELDMRITELKRGGMNAALASEIAKLEQVHNQGTRNLEQDKKALQEKIRNSGWTDELGTKLKEINKALEERVKLLGMSTEELKKYIEAQKDANTETDKNKVTTEQIKEQLATGMQSAIEGLIDGTKSLGESLAGIAKSIGSMFLQAGIRSMFNLSAEGSYNTAGGFRAFAQGGVTTGPTLGLIGEAGEPEYVIPASKMEGAMGRYSAGARGQAVIPGGGTVASGSGVYGGSVQIDYTGPILSFNSEDYVPKSAVPEIINRAARRGAEAGQTQVFSQLKNSRSQRSRIGL